MKNRVLIAPLLAFAMMTTPAMTAHAESWDGVNFGDDAGDFANDGECDDLRFTGEGMTETPLLPDDIFRDASDCHTAYLSGTVTLAPMFIRLSGEAEIVWGDDSGDFARDGECDDLRFEGPGLTETPLLTDDIGHDATDCRMAYKKGEISWRMGAIAPLLTAANYA
ncbi:hypothetical protein EKN06_12490 [Croceicoccus ponticola]|uniref:DUF3617 family protein n=1 Tax=Croceicoccus ponticola TaxID=2217664 RepID=A0A437GVB9_9SPHN|nr:hypothetical protein [Croceicoccus ponticola]RVQ65745.1 hypothetical protein EKN06_12490 [Croceicoccus ponticola]